MNLSFGNARIAKALEDWRDRDMISQTDFDALSADLAARSTGFPFRNILILIAVIFLGFAAMTFVAANWEEMSRIARVILIVSAMWVCWGLAAYFTGRGSKWFAAVFTLGACAIFGAGIMLIAQLYHIQGKPVDAVWLWAIGTGLAAILTRSIPALVLTIILFGLWEWFRIFDYRSTADGDWIFLAYLAVLSGLAYWMKSRISAHLLAISLVIWLLVKTDGNQDPALLLTIACFLPIQLALFSERAHNFLRGFEPALLGYAFFTLGAAWLMAGIDHDAPKILDQSIPLFAATLTITFFICGAIAFYARGKHHPNQYDLTVTPIIVLLIGTVIYITPIWIIGTFAMALILSIWLLRMGWRLDARILTVLGWIGFAISMLWIYFETVGSLIGTSLFYLTAGILLLAIVFVAPKLNARLRKGVSS